MKRGIGNIKNGSSVSGAGASVPHTGGSSNESCACVVGENTQRRRASKYTQAVSISSAEKRQQGQRGGDRYAADDPYYYKPHTKIYVYYVPGKKFVQYDSKSIIDRDAKIEY